MIAGVPYDAEVEYLESTGTQWIDTGIRFLPVGSAFDVSMTVRFTAVPGSNYAGSGYTSNREQMFYALNPNPSTGLYMACNGRTNIANGLSSDKTAWHTCSAKTENGSVLYYFDSILKSSFPFFSFTLPCFYLFTLGEPYLNPHGLTGYQQISAVRLSVDSEPVLDLIPVRFTNELGQTEGAMYDRVTKRLFRNKGTGAFLWGRDVAKPVMGLHFMKPKYTKYTAKDYVQDGLIAMWDGIENAGWGQHDPNATTWKDLAGNRDLEFGSSVTISDNYIATTTTNYMTVPTDEINGVQTIQVCVRSAGVGGAEITVKRGQYLRLVGNTIYANGNTSTGNAAHATIGTITTTANVTYTVTGPWMNQDKFYQNAEDRTSLGEANWWRIRNGLVIGVGYGDNSTSGSGSKIYGIRLYSRALNAAEVSANCAVDKARFNLPEVTA